MLQSTLELLAPLDYKLVVSGRARRLTLRVEPGRGVIVTIPRRFPKRDVPAFVEKHRDWVESVMLDIVAKTPEHYRQWPPRNLYLKSMDRQIEILYTAEQEPDFDICVGSVSAVTTLVIVANPDDKASVATEIARFLMKLAKQLLPPRLAQLAAKHALTYSRVQIRGQRTVWGSYSTSGTLSLNYKLLFLSADLVDYVLLHELAHTLCMDHSPVFWRHLEALQSGAKALDGQLAESGREVPPWLELAR